MKSCIHYNEALELCMVLNKLCDGTEKHSCYEAKDQNK